jgi:RNA-directed DNA polymerase
LTEHRDFRTSDRYLAISNLRLLQQQAGVDTGVAELVVAFGRLLVDAGEPLQFDPRPFRSGSIEEHRFRELIAANPSADEGFLAFVAAYSARMLRKRTTPIINRDDLAAQLGYSPRALAAIVARSASFYREIRLPRKNGSFRIIHSPSDPIRGAQGWIFRKMLASYRPSDVAHGFVRGRSIVTNASQHVGHTVLVMADIAEFFPTITFRRVRKAFEKLGYPYSVAVTLANLCTRNGVLPQGAPTSPALSNIVCEGLDARLQGLAVSRGFAYSRYADDLAFSSDDRRLPSLLPFIREIVKDEGFELRREKTRIARRGARRVVTGVVVNERPNLPRAHVRRLRAALHALATKGPGAVKIDGARPDADPLSVLAGHIAFLTMVNPARGRSLVRHMPSGRTDV